MAIVPIISTKNLYTSDALAQDSGSEVIVNTGGCIGTVDVHGGYNCYCPYCIIYYQCGSWHSCPYYPSGGDSGSGGCGSGGSSGGSSGSGGTGSTSSSTSPMGDPIDPQTGLPDVTNRFNQDIALAFEQFCGYSYMFNVYVSEYGYLMQGLINYPQDYMNYMEYFINQVKGGGPWDLKYPGNGYSPEDLGNTNTAIYNGQEYNFDDFGNITFGIAAAAYGFPITIAKFGAGFYQAYKSDDWKLSYVLSYFDNPRDSEMIQKGYDIFNSSGGCGGFLNN